MGYKGIKDRSGGEDEGKKSKIRPIESYPRLILALDLTGFE